MQVKSKGSLRTLMCILAIMTSSTGCGDEVGDEDPSMPLYDDDAVGSVKLELTSARARCAACASP